MKIYVLTNKINGKKYVGQTRRSVQTRWIHHQTCARLGVKTALYHAIRKHGSESFNVEVIDEATSLDELDILERKWIGFFGTFGNKGYNLTDGGGVNREVHFSTKRKLSDASRGTKRNEETKKLLSTISSSRKRPDRNKAAQAVDAYDGDGRYLYSEPSYSAMGRRSGKGIRTVQRCCDFRCGTRDRKWFFFPSGMYGKRLSKKIMKNASFRGTRKGTREVQRLLKPSNRCVSIEKNGVTTSYKSISEAARALNIHPMRVSRALKPNSLETDFKVKESDYVVA